MAPFIVSLCLLFILYTSFSSCAPQGSTSHLTTRATANFKARIAFANACTDDQRDTLNKLLNSFGQILDAQAYWKPHGDYQSAMDMYLGTDSTSTRLFRNYLKRITANFRRAWLGVRGFAEDRDFDYWLYCGNEAWSESYCTRATTWSSWSYYKFNWGPYFYYWTVFCPLFWKTPTLTSVFQKIDVGEVDGTDMNSYYPTQTLYFMAAFFSLSPAVSNPYAGYNGFTPSEAINLATKLNTGQASRSTFNHVYAALAIFLQRDLSLPYPPSPKGTTNMSPASVASLPPIGNGAFTPLKSGVSSTPGGPPIPTILASLNNSTPDIALEQAIAIGQILRLASAGVAAANGTQSTIGTVLSTAKAPSPTATVAAAPSLTTTSYITTISPSCTFTSLLAGGPELYGPGNELMGHCQCGSASTMGYWAPNATVCTAACVSLSTLCATFTISDVFTVA